MKSDPRELYHQYENWKHIYKYREKDYTIDSFEGLLFSCKMHVLHIHRWRQLSLPSSTLWFTFLDPFVFFVAFYFNHEEEEIFMPALRTIKICTGDLILHRTTIEHHSTWPSPSSSGLTPFRRYSRKFFFFTSWYSQILISSHLKLFARKNVQQ